MANTIYSILLGILIGATISGAIIGYFQSISNYGKIADLQKRVAALEREAQERQGMEITLDGKELLRDPIVTLWKRIP